MIKNKNDKVVILIHKYIFVHNIITIMSKTILVSYRNTSPSTRTIVAMKCDWLLGLTFKKRATVLLILHRTQNNIKYYRSIMIVRILHVEVYHWLIVVVSYQKFCDTSLIITSSLPVPYTAIVIQSICSCIFLFFFFFCASD